ncbi:Serpin I2 [Myotis brandtii]|uniref:Serpin I2 n=1 Tax=Myotis brandtii TaxID=109478 RepID=S7NU66_MYOBR|nr:Serpin I2 [Myotis brandtii]
MFKIVWSLLLTFSGSQASKPLAQRNTEFAVDLYQAICSSQKDNIVFSPLGTTLILGMVQLGAKGKAYQQIRQTLKVQENSTGEEFSALKSFFSAISKKKQEFTFNLANALYLQEGFTVKEQYLHGNEKFFQSAIKLVDFQNAKACAETISAWVESKTDGKIKGMFSGEEFGPLTRLILVNAIYFKGDWKQKFRKEGTELMNFTKKDGATVKIPMMKALLRTKHGYFSESSMKYQVLELPYKDDEFSLIIILPAEEAVGSVIIKTTDRSEKEDASGSITPCYGYKGAQCTNSCTLKGTVGSKAAVSTEAGLGPSLLPPPSPSHRGPGSPVYWQPRSCSRCFHTLMEPAPTDDAERLGLALSAGVSSGCCCNRPSGTGGGGEAHRGD